MSNEIKKEEIRESVEAALEQEVEVELKLDASKDLTQVKTLQQIAVEQGKQLPKQLTPEQYQGQLLLDHHMGMSAVVPAFNKLGKNGMMRLWNAIMQLPQEGLEVHLNGNFEKQIYLAAQKAQMAKHAILFSRAKQEAAMEAKATAETEKKRLQNIALTDTVSVEGAAPQAETKTEEVIKI